MHSITISTCSEKTNATTFTLNKYVSAVREKGRKICQLSTHLSFRKKFKATLGSLPPPHTQYPCNSYASNVPVLPTHRFTTADLSAIMLETRQDRQILNLCFTLTATDVAASITKNSER